MTEPAYILDRDDQIEFFKHFTFNTDGTVVQNSKIDYSLITKICHENINKFFSVYNTSKELTILGKLEFQYENLRSPFMHMFRDVNQLLKEGFANIDKYSRRKYKTVSNVNKHCVNDTDHYLYLIVNNLLIKNLEELPDNINTDLRNVLNTHLMFMKLVKELKAGSDNIKSENNVLIVTKYGTPLYLNMTDEQFFEYRNLLAFNLENLAVINEQLETVISDIAELSKSFNSWKLHNRIDDYNIVMFIRYMLFLTRLSLIHI